jgi:hypothetical protein
MIDQLKKNVKEAALQIKRQTQNKNNRKRPDKKGALSRRSKSACRQAIVKWITKTADDDNFRIQNDFGF